MNKQKSFGKAILPLAILDVLSRHSDIEHPLQQREIADYLKDEFGLTPHRKTLSANLDNLIAADHPIACRESERRLPDGELQRMRTDYYYEHFFDDSELTLLIDSIYSSKHIPPRQLNELIDKLSTLSSRYFRGRPQHVRAIAPKKNYNNQYFLNIAIIDEAIDRGLSITCEYLTYGTNLELESRRDSEGEIRSYHLDPYELAAVNGFYYLICSKRPYETISHYRIDRIHNVRIHEDIPIRPVEELSGIPEELTLPKHLAEHIYMFDGPSIEVSFLADRAMLDALMDWFSDNLRVTKVAEDKLMVKVTVNEQAMFYWSLQYGPNIQVLQPASLRERIRSKLETMLDRYTVPRTDIVSRHVAESEQPYVIVSATGHSKTKELTRDEYDTDYNENNEYAGGKQ